jgi:hypothetical protein
VVVAVKLAAAEEKQGHAEPSRFLEVKDDQQDGCTHFFVLALAGE